MLSRMHIITGAMLWCISHLLLLLSDKEEK